MFACACSVVSDSLRPHGLYVACQAPLSIEFFQARILEQVAISFSRGSSWTRDRAHSSCVSCIGRKVLYQLDHWGNPTVDIQNYIRFSCIIFNYISSIILVSVGASLVAQMVKCLPAIWETQVQILGWEDPLEKEMATHSSTLAWKIPWTEEPCGLQSKELDMTEHLNTHTHIVN